jgi:N-acylneuraminate cytidylyltransferase
MRPTELAQDDTRDLPVFEHAVRWLVKHEGYLPDYVVQLRPTSPIRPKDMIDQAVEKLSNHPEADSVRGVVPAGENPHKMWRIDPAGQMQSLLHVEGINEPYNAPRQKLPQVFWQTGHIDVVRPEVILEKHSISGDAVLPVFIDPAFKVDIDDLGDWSHAERLVREGGLDMVHPGRTPRPWPDKVSLVVFDFDGVMTDNRVWVDQNGVESVAANRSDGMGVEMLLAAGFKGVIISSEPNPVVAARAKKIGLPYFHGIGDIFAR